MSNIGEKLGLKLANLHNSPLLSYVISMPRYAKRTILIFLDFILLCFALWAAFSLRLGMLYYPTSNTLATILLIAPCLVVLSLHYNGLYKMITRYLGREGIVKIVISISYAVLVWCLVIYMSTFGLESIPRSVIVMFGLFSVLLLSGLRGFISFLFRDFIPSRKKIYSEKAIPVLVYGVGELGNQLCNDLIHSNEHKLIGFIDDNKSLWRQTLNGMRVHSPENLVDVVVHSNIKELYLAEPNLKRRRKRELVNLLAPYSVQVKTLPAHYEIATGKVQISDLRNIGIEDLLGRSPVPPIHDLLNKNVQNKCVMITGAGGSIGSEITRQVAKLAPSKIVLFERSEIALYNIEVELRAFLTDLGTNIERETEIVCVLGSILDDQLIRETIDKHKVQTLYHTAAYKHVPLVEDNPFVGLKNNVFGTLNTAIAANDLNVELFVLISTDKAVRPTSVMGASKRIAELCLQALAKKDDTKTIFTMVRFGNVLGSSGSVVGRFREQIEKGGPITVTHPDIIRYFMMIPEAAQLVIQAGGLAKGGDVYVLDMGQPVKIDDLARSMIHLSGLEVLDETNPDGDIAIEYIGLRGGEKLFEELLIRESSTTTIHKSIIKNHENHISYEKLKEQLDVLQDIIELKDKEKMYDVLSMLVEDYSKQKEAERNSKTHESISKQESIRQLQ